MAVEQWLIRGRHPAWPPPSSFRIDCFLRAKNHMRPCLVLKKWPAFYKLFAVVGVNKVGIPKILFLHTVRAYPDYGRHPLWAIRFIMTLDLSPSNTK